MNTNRTFVCWQDDEGWRVLHPATGVLSIGPGVDELVEHTRFIAALHLGEEIAASDVEVTKLPDCRAAVRKAQAAYREERRAAGDAALEEAAQILRAAGWAEREIGTVLGYLIVK